MAWNLQQLGRGGGPRAIRTNQFHVLGFYKLAGVDPRAAWLPGMWETLRASFWILFWNKGLEDYKFHWIHFLDLCSILRTEREVLWSLVILQAEVLLRFWLQLGELLIRPDFQPFKLNCWGDIKVVAQILRWWHFECFSKPVDCMTRFLTCP